MSRLRFSMAGVAAAVGVPLLLLASTSCGVPAASSGTIWSVSAASTQFADVYFADQTTAQFTITTDAARVAWTATDFSGTVEHQGQATITAGKATVTIPTDGALGWFYLHVDAYNGTTQVAATQTSYAVIDHPATAVLDSPFGYSTHISKPGPEDPPATYPLLADAETSMARTDLPYDETGATTWPHDAVLTQVKSTGVTPLLILDSYHAMDQSDFPAYTAFAKEAAAHYASITHYYEIGNEWNYKHSGDCLYSDLAANAQCYATLVEDTYPALKAGDPNAVAVIGASANYEMGAWWDDVLTDLAAAKAPLADWHIAFSIHPYETGDPELLRGTLTGVEKVFAEHGLSHVPVWISEQGWPTCGTGSVDEHQQARDLVRAQILAVAGGVSRSLWYEFVDYGVATDDRENCFGTLHNVDSSWGAYTPKPGFVANVVLHQVLRGDVYTGADFTAGERSDTTFGYWFTGASEVHVFWNEDGTSTVTVTSKSGFRTTNIMGVTTSYPAGTVRLTADGNPLFVVGTLTSVK